MPTSAPYPSVMPRARAPCPTCSHAGAASSYSPARAHHRVQAGRRPRSLPRASIRPAAGCCATFRTSPRRLAAGTVRQPCPRSRAQPHPRRWPQRPPHHRRHATRLPAQAVHRLHLRLPGLGSGRLNQAEQRHQAHKQFSGSPALMNCTSAAHLAAGHRPHLRPGVGFAW